MYDLHGIGLMRRSSNDERQLRLHSGIATGQFHYLVDQRDRHIVDDEPPQVLQVISSL
jgi:hypothetical protein